MVAGCPKDDVVDPNEKAEGVVAPKDDVDVFDPNADREEVVDGTFL